MTARKLLLPVLVAGFLCFPAKRAEAIDPVTIAILTPIAIKVARQASPYIIRSMRAGSAHLLKTGKHMLNIFLLPLGCLEMTLGRRWACSATAWTTRSTESARRFCWCTTCCAYRWRSAGSVRSRICGKKLAIQPENMYFIRIGQGELDGIG